VLQTSARLSKNGSHFIVAVRTDDCQCLILKQSFEILIGWRSIAKTDDTEKLYKISLSLTRHTQPSTTMFDMAGLKPDFSTGKVSRRYHAGVFLQFKMKRILDYLWSALSWRDDFRRA
jgi:hypothetical protein